MRKPLEGVRVVELSTFVAAPVCGRLLRDLGAEVVKIEAAGGDMWRETVRMYVPDVYNDDHNPIYDLYNTGKHHISLNLKTKEGMEALHKLLAKADVFLTNTRYAALERLGLTYEQLKEKYPSLIYAFVVGYGEKGPDKDLPAFDTTAFWSRSGFLRDLANDDGEHYQPVTPPGGVGDTFTGYLLLSQINAALYRRTFDGQGELVKSGLYHNAIFGMGSMNIKYQEESVPNLPSRRSLGYSFMGSYGCADGEWIYFSRGTVKDFENKIARMVGLDCLTEDPEFQDPVLRKINREKHYVMFKEAFLKQTSTYWLEKLKELDVAGLRMSHFKDVHKDEQAWANDYLEHMQFRDGTTGVMPTCPIEMESVGKVPSKPAPKVGHDTVAVLQDLGYSEAEINDMIATGAVAIKRKV